MNLMLCSICHHVYQIGGNPDEVVNLVGKKNYPCITPLCTGTMIPWSLDKAIPSQFTAVEVPIRTFFRAVNGFGAPDGKAAELEEAVSLLKTKRITEVHAEQVGQPERIILRELVLDDGTVLHFDASSRGACLYYIEKPRPSCLEVVDHE